MPEREEAGRILPLNLRESLAWLTPCTRTSGLQNSGRRTFGDLEAPSVRSPCHSSLRTLTGPCLHPITAPPAPGLHTWAPTCPPHSAPPSGSVPTLPPPYPEPGHHPALPASHPPPVSQP